ncbi:hypothetical protein H4S06_005015 [Coemansia sp. BCRC 34490]|nr:hypothetical protein H4S06_005015 [Coemansia sp. BCRC 34490]
MIPTISEDSDYDSAGASEDENRRLADRQQDLATPGPIEKMVIASTGVSNLLLVRRLLRENRGDEGQVIELLIQWMADDPDNPDQWWAEDGSADYAGPLPPQPEDAATLVDNQPVSKPSDEGAAITNGDGTKEQPDGEVDEVLAAASAVASEGNDVHKDRTEHAIEDDGGDTEEPQHHASKKNPKKPVKGAARQKKAESKKRQKEMAKIRKRQAAGTTGSANNSTGPERSGEETVRKLSNQINHIYI